MGRTASFPSRNSRHQAVRSHAQLDLFRKAEAPDRPELPACFERVGILIRRLLNMRQHLLRYNKSKAFAMDMAAHVRRVEQYLQTHPYIGPAGCMELRTQYHQDLHAITPANPQGWALLNELFHHLNQAPATAGKPDPSAKGTGGGGSTIY